MLFEAYSGGIWPGLACRHHHSFFPSQKVGWPWLPLWCWPRSVTEYRMELADVENVDYQDFRNISSASILVASKLSLLFSQLYFLMSLKSTVF